MAKELRSSYFEALESVAVFLSGAPVLYEISGGKITPEAVCKAAISRLKKIKECIASGIAVNIPEDE